MVRIIIVNAILVLTNGFAALRAYQNIHELFNAEKKRKKKKTFSTKFQNLKSLKLAKI